MNFFSRVHIDATILCTANLIHIYAYCFQYIHFKVAMEISNSVPMEITGWPVVPAIIKMI